MRRWLALLLSILVVLGAGCIDSHTARPFKYISVPSYAGTPLKVYKVWVDRNFGEADKVAIDNAIRQWNYALNGYVIIRVETYQFDMEVDSMRRAMLSGWMVMKINSGNPMLRTVDQPAKPGEKQYYTLAWVNVVGGNRMWVVRDRIQNDWMEGVLLHEIGHLLGSDHDRALLMRPHFNWAEYRCVDYEALRRVAVHQHLPMERLNYCEYGLRDLRKR